ncbi:MAG TPA: hypothetical protein VFZ03_01900 [Dongiaceae bacterium]
MASARGGMAELERCRGVLMARADLERRAMRIATEDMQDASDGVVGLAVTAVRLMRQFWLPIGITTVGALSRRARPVLRAARAGLAVWHVVRMLRNARR